MGKLLIFYKEFLYLGISIRMYEYDFISDKYFMSSFFHKFVKYNHKLDILDNHKIR